MKTLSAALLAAQKAAVRTPYVEAEISDIRGGVRRLRWTRWYTGSETDAPVAAVVADDGGLVRWRNNAGSVDYSRVASPGSGSTWDTWTTGVETAFSGSDVALVRLPDGTLWGFFIETDHTTIERIASADDGATFVNTNTAVVSAGNDRDRMAAAVNDDGDVLLLWNEGATVRSSLWTGASWSAPANWTNTIASCTGLAVAWAGDWQVLVAGTEATTLKPTVWAVRLGDGFAATAGTWGALRVVTQASADSDVTYSRPAVTNSLLGGYRGFCVESFGGDAAYDRVQVLTKNSQFDFNTASWWDTAPFDYAGNALGVAVAEHDVGAYLVASDGVWNGVSRDEVVVSGDVVLAEVTCDERGSRGRLELDNADGGYSAYGSGDLESVALGGQLVLNPGYVTASGNEVNTTRDYVYAVTGIELVSGARPRLVLHFRGMEWWLERWRARRHYDLAGLPVSSMAFVVCAQAGLNFGGAGSQSSGYDVLSPGFLVQPGERGDQVLDRVLAVLPEVWRASGDGIQAVNPASGDASAYAFGGEHVILEGRYGEGARRWNSARVLGEGVVGDAYDFDEIEGLGLAQVVLSDRRFGDSDDAADRAAVALRDAVLEADECEIGVPVHCGLELYDVVDVTDAGAGLSASKRRVRGYRWRLDRLRGLYQMTVRLGAV